MGSFPFNCRHCRGGDGQCAIRRQRERAERSEAIQPQKEEANKEGREQEKIQAKEKKKDKKENEEEGEDIEGTDEEEEEEYDYEDDEEEEYVPHANCEGGQFCYSDEIVVHVGESVILGCHYTSYGSATIEGHKIYSCEFSQYFDCWGGVKLVADEFMCADCYEDRESSFSRKEEIDGRVPDDNEYRRKHALYVLKSKLDIPLPVIQHHIMPYLKNCSERKDRFDCLLCTAIGRSYYTSDREEELRCQREEEEDDEDDEDEDEYEEQERKKPRLSFE